MNKRGVALIEFSCSFPVYLTIVCFIVLGFLVLHDFYIVQSHSQALAREFAVDSANSIQTNAQKGIVYGNQELSLQKYKEALDELYFYKVEQDKDLSITIDAHYENVSDDALKGKPYTKVKISGAYIVLKGSVHRNDEVVPALVRDLLPEKMDVERKVRVELNVNATLVMSSDLFKDPAHNNSGSSNPDSSVPDNPGESGSGEETGGGGEVGGTSGEGNSGSTDVSGSDGGGESAPEKLIPATVMTETLENSIFKDFQQTQDFLSYIRGNQKNFKDWYVNCLGMDYEDIDFFYRVNYYASNNEEWGFFAQQYADYFAHVNGQVEAVKTMANADEAVDTEPEVSVLSTYTLTIPKDMSIRDYMNSVETNSVKYTDKICDEYMILYYSVNVGDITVYYDLILKTEDTPTNLTINKDNYKSWLEKPGDKKDFAGISVVGLYCENYNVNTNSNKYNFPGISWETAKESNYADISKDVYYVRSSPTDNHQCRKMLQVVTKEDGTNEVVPVWQTVYSGVSQYSAFLGYEK